MFLRVLLDPTMEDSPAIPVGRTRSSPYARQTAIVILASTWPCNTAQAAVSTARSVSFRHLRSSLALLPHDGAGSRADGLVRGLRACPQGGPGCALASGDAEPAEFKKMIMKPGVTGAWRTLNPPNPWSKLFRFVANPTNLKS